MKKTAFVLALVFALSIVAGCSTSAKPQDFSKAGMTITLTDAFTEKDIVAQTAYYESIDSIVTALKEERSVLEEAGIPAETTLGEYAAIVVEANGFDTDVTESGGLTYFTFEKALSGKDFSYLATIFESDDAFWLIQFASETKNYEKFEPTFKEWAKSVKFS